MNIFKKLDSMLDFNNTFSVKRVLTIISNEFNSALQNKDYRKTSETIAYVRKIYDRLELTYRESEDYGSTMSFHQKMWAKKLRNFISYMTIRSKKTFGINDNETEIGNAIQQNSR
jgi:flagellin-specific chaperone FliS